RNTRLNVCVRLRARSTTGASSPHASSWVRSSSRASSSPSGVMNPMSVKSLPHGSSGPVGNVAPTSALYALPAVPTMMLLASPTVGLLADRSGWADAHPQGHADAPHVGVLVFRPVLRACLLADCGDAAVGGGAAGEQFPGGAYALGEPHGGVVVGVVAVD